MVCYPEVQKEAQVELDNVLNGTLPEHSDLPSLPYLSALVKEVYRYAAVLFEYSLLSVNCVSRWQLVGPLGNTCSFLTLMVSSWHLCLVKASRISWSSMISTTTIISPPTLWWLPTNGDGHLLSIEFSLISQTQFIGRCWMTNGSIQNRMSSSPSAFWKMEN